MTGAGKKSRIPRVDLLRTIPEGIQNTIAPREGQIVRLKANYFRVTHRSEWKLYQYHVKFEPNIDVTRIKGNFFLELS